MTPETRERLAISHGLVWGSLATWGVSFLAVPLWIAPMLLAILFLADLIRS